MSLWVNAEAPATRAVALSARAATGSPLQSTPVAVLVGVGLGIALCLPKLVAVWQSGAFFDTDDAMHLVQVRDWLAGQGWFDLTAHRLDPPLGASMHWTRMVDVPLALLIRFFALFAPQETAERLMRIAYPLMLQFVFFAAMASAARKTTGARGVAVAVVLAAFSTAAIIQFPAGRINHHNVQITLLMFMLGAILDVFDPRRARRGFLAAALAALSLTISIENLPFIVMMIAIFAAAWIVRGASIAPAMAWLGGGLAACATAAFAAVVAPQHYADKVCDAFSGAHLIAAIGGGAGLVLLAAATPRLPNTGSRLAAAALAGAVAFGAVMVAFPECLKDPFSAVDPLVRQVWLDNVTQGQSLAALLGHNPTGALPMVMPVFLGFVCACAAACREHGDTRARWLVVAGFAAVGLAGSFWQIRTVVYATPVALLGGAWLFVRWFSWAAQRKRPALLVASLLMLAFVPIAWAMAASALGAAAAEPAADQTACFAPAAFSAIDALPPDVVLAPIDAGPYLLALTRHAVIAGPYHRNNHGNRLAIEIFLGDAVKARALMRASGARYLAICRAAAEMSLYASRAPGGFAALLRAGFPPAWLKRVNISGTPYEVYEIR